AAGPLARQGHRRHLRGSQPLRGHQPAPAPVRHHAEPARPVRRAGGGPAGAAGVEGRAVRRRHRTAVVRRRHGQRRPDRRPGAGDGDGGAADPGRAGADRDRARTGHRPGL
ncbi:MAG: hypothetical protein AVDCRST_MAG07-2591, partial [uncultured Frankineae bacterium]